MRLRLINIAVLAFASVQPAEARRADPILAPLSPAQWRAAGVGGTGCVWMARADGPVLLAMADDKAVASIAGGLTILSPDPGARDLFPFTHDAWRTRNRRLVISVRKSPAGRRIGTETVEHRTDLTLTRRGRRFILHGVMQCGS